MTRRTGSIPDAYFEALYQGDGDPWHFASSDYERDKYTATLAALDDGRVTRAFEVGCSIGVFTHALAARCESLLAVDVAETALAAARIRCAEHPHVELRQLRIPEQWPDGSFDLIILSEVLYYLVAADVMHAARRCRDSLLPGGRLVLVHWTGETDYPCTGDEAASLFISASGPELVVTAQYSHPQYRLDVMRRPRVPA